MLVYCFGGGGLSVRRVRLAVQLCIFGLYNCLWLSSIHASLPSYYLHNVAGPVAIGGEASLPLPFPPLPSLPLDETLQAHILP